MTKYDSIFDTIQNNSYQTTKKKKKNYDEQFGDIQNNSYELIAPINSNQEPENAIDKIKGINPKDIINTSQFDDGYQFGDITKTIIGTGADIYQDLSKGAISNLEGIADALTNYASIGVEKAGKKDWAENMRKFAQKNIGEESGLYDRLSTYNTLGVTNTILNGNIESLNPFNREAIKKNVESFENTSLFGEKTDEITQGVGQLVGQAALNSVGVPWQLTAFLNSAGNEMNNAFQNGADYQQALISSTISGLGEVGSEYLGGGANKLLGMSSVGEKVFEKLGSKITNKVISRLTKLGFDMASEGAEEVVSGYIQALGQKMTYMSDKEINEIYSSEQALEDFIGGALVSGVANVPGNVRGVARGENAWTNRTENEQKVYDAVLEERIAEQEKDGKKLTQKQINAIEEQLEKDMAKGRISVSQIENALGFGDRVNNLVHDSEIKLGRKLSQQEINDIRDELSEQYFKDISKDTMLQNSYYENSQKSKGFDFDAKKYKGKQLEILQKAKDSGILNNTGATHEFVDFISKVAADKNVNFDFTNNEKLKNSSFAVNGADVNGFVTNDGITLNIDSKKSLNSVVGHEITHILEGTDVYDTLQESLKEYVGENKWNEKLAKLEELYSKAREQGNNVDTTKELTADLVGDYLFTNQEFINHLTQNRNLFQKIYDEIKYLVKQATAGSKEQRQLLKAQKMFEQAYRDNKVKMAEQENTKYSITKDNGIQAINDYINSNNYVYNNNGVLKVNNLNDKQIKDLVKIYHATGYEDVSTDYLVNRLKEGNMPLQREIADRFIEKELGYKPTIDTTQIFEDAEGNPLTKEQVEFYKDSGVRDIRGRLIPVYHRTNADFTVFDEKAGTQHGKKYGKGFYFSTTPENYGNNTMKVYLNAKDGEFKYVPKMGYYIVQEPNMIKNVDNKAPTNNSDIRYSLSTDSNGRELTEQQQEYFKDSKARDENGKLVPVYHGTTEEINVFDKNRLGNNTGAASAGEGFFFTDSKKVATDYSRYARPQYIKDLENEYKRLEKEAQKTGNWDDYYRAYEKYEDAELTYAYNEDNQRTNAENQKEVYLNLTNPLIHDFKGMEYRDESYYDLLKQAKENGNDGAIFKNTYDGYGEKGTWENPMTNIYVAFESNQIKNVDNLNPTSNEDIRYSLTQKVDTELDELTDDQYNYFKNTKAVDNEGELEVVYHGTPNKFNIFDINKARANQFMDGFYFTNAKATARAFSGSDEGLYSTSDDNIIEGYVNIEHPVSRESKTITFDQLKEIYNRLQENPNYQDEDMEGWTYFDDVLSNYGDVNQMGIDKLLRTFYDSYNTDEVLVENMLSRNNKDIMYSTLRDVTGIDGQIVHNPTGWDDFENYYIAFNPDQFKLKSNKTPTNNVDMNLSLSRTGEDIAPIGNYNVYGKDIALQEELVPVKEDLSRLNTEIAAIREDYNKQAEEIKSQIQELKDLRENLFTDNTVDENYYPVETQNNIEEAPYYQESTVALDDKALKKYKEYFKDSFDIKGRQLTQAMEGIKELSKNPNLTKSDVYKYMKQNFGKEETRVINDEISDAKYELRNTPIGVTDDIKKDIAYTFDTYGKFRKQNFGKLKLIDYNGSNAVDQVYIALNEQFPDLFPEDITNPVDQLLQIHEVANGKDYKSYFRDLPDNEIRAYSDELYGMIQEYRQDTLKSLAEAPLPQEYFDNLAPYEEESEVSIDEELNKLEQKLNGLKNLEGMDILNAKRTFDEITNPEEISQIEKDTANILDLINQEEQRRNGNVKLVEPKISPEKSTLRKGIDTLKTMFINKNAEIDNLAKESGNKNIKFAGDMLNNYSAEAQNDIEIAQTNNEGKEIGKSLTQIFEPVKEKGLETQFNDYLVNYSNIDRWNNNKGSKTPIDVSERIVADYEARYPEFRRYAKDVWNYGKNYLNNMHDAGLINDYIYNYLGEKYQHYVPYITDSNTFDATLDSINELKARGIKKAYGGSTEVLPVEEALTRYTYAQKRALRTNELYKEIVNELYTDADKSNPPAQDRLEDYTNLTNNLYRDDAGNNYLTAFINGEEKSVKVSDDLFKSLRNDMDTRIKDVEKRLSMITKPLQTAGKLRRNILTSWSPSFMIKNPVKDIQDALLNSKHTADMVKNYPSAVKELWSDSTPEVRQFKALYGSGNTMGQYDVESGLYNPKIGNKNNNFLKILPRVNETMELAPRYAEFKASLQAGESYQEAMYNAREITTNFSRGGVITKALNRNGFTFLNANVQGFDKFIRNFSGENGAKGIVNSLVKAAIFGVSPAIFNELAFGTGDDKDEDYDALPDYIKDNYYLIKTGNGKFIRIPKGRMLSVFGSAARRTIEAAAGEENAFEGFLENANNQVGISNPEENNIFAPLIQAFGSENGTAWYGGDIVPSRLQDKPANEQYDASTDKFSIWLSNTALGKKLGLSPYKVNYIIDQYSGGVGDLALPYITDEAESEGGLLAPIKDQFTADSTTDNKYVSDFYSKNDELKVKANSSEATDLDKVKNQYMYSVSSEMAKLYAERRAVQSNNSLTKAEKYKKSQAIKDEINKLAKEGLDNYANTKVTGNYASAGDEEFYKNAKGKWTTIDADTKEEINSLGLTNVEKNSYFNAKNDIYNTTQEYKTKLENASETEKATLNTDKKKSIINTIKSSGLTDDAKANLYDKSYASTDTLNAILNCNIDFDSYLDLQAQSFTADKDSDGKSINGSKKAKVYNYINQLNIPYEKKIMLAKLEYKSDDTYNNEIIGYLNNDPTIDYQDMKSILKAMGMKVDEYGNITW